MQNIFKDKAWGDIYVSYTSYSGFRSIGNGDLPSGEAWSVSVK